MSSRFEQRVIDEFIAWKDAQGTPPMGAAGRDRIAILLQGRADYLDRPGAVAVIGANTEPDPGHVATAAMRGTAVWAVHPEPGLMANLTDPGRYLVRQRLLAENAAVPLTD